MANPNRSCTSLTKKGKPCRAIPLPGTDKCISHSPKEVQESLGFGGSQPGAGRPKTPRAVDVIRDRIEADLERVLAPLFNALDADRGIALAIKGGGMEIGFVADHEVRLRAVRELLDRAYGRPTQQTEITGPNGGPVREEVTLRGDNAWHAEVAAVLAEAGALTAGAAIADTSRDQVNGNGSGRNGHGPDPH